MRHQPYIHAPGMVLRLVAVLFLTLSPIDASHAAQILVTAGTDAISDGDGCGLREALINANTDSKSGSAECARGVGDDVIVLPPQTIAFSASNSLDISSNVTIFGGGGAWSIIDAWNHARIFDVQDGATLTLRGLQLLRGQSNDSGGAVRVRTGGTLNAEFVVVSSSRVDPTVANAQGGGVFIASGATASIVRSEISYNEVLGAGGEGGGIYCASGCRLKSLEATTITGNKAAAAGGGIFIAGNASADLPPYVTGNGAPNSPVYMAVVHGNAKGLSFVTVSANTAVDGAGIKISGAASLFGVLSADNGAGEPGADLSWNCSSASISASQTFVESQTVVLLPSESCSAPAGIVDRDILTSSLPSALPAEVLYGTSGSPYEGAPGRTHKIRESFYPYLGAQIPAADSRCVGLLDEHGRKRVPNTACDLGAFQSAVLSIWKMGFGLATADGPKGIFIHLSDPPSVATRVRLTPVYGVGEPCSGFEAFVDFAPGQSLQTLFVDPAAVFALPGLNRPSRVCEMSAEVIAGDFVGATAGSIRAKVIGSPVATTGFSSPGVGYYLDFGSVPVGFGGSRPLQFTPNVGGFNLTKVSFIGVDMSMFEISSPAATESVPGEFVFATPVLVNSVADGGTTIQVRCKGGQLGDFEAEMMVTTDSPVYGELSYGVRCTPEHVLAFTVEPLRVQEDGGVATSAVLVLDSPCQLTGSGECFRVDMNEVAGTATSGVDYQSVAQTVVFMAGEQQKIVPVRVIDDGDVEGDELFGIAVVPPTLPFLQMRGERTATLTILDNDELSRDVKVFLRGLPSIADPGETLPFEVAIHNRGNAGLRGVKVEISVEQPMWIRNFAILGATCSIAASKRKATCNMADYLAPNQKPLLDANGDPLSVEADETDTTRWNDLDWKTVPGRLITADMTRPPTIDVSGVVSVNAKAGASPVVETAAARSLMIDAPPLGAAGGAPVPGASLVLLALLLLRRLGTAIGRKSEWS